MIFVEKLDEYLIDNVVICERSYNDKIREINEVEKNIYFHKILYSSQYYTLNGIFIVFSLFETKKITNHLLNFNVLNTVNINTLNKIKNIEQMLLSDLNIYPEYIKLYKLNNMLNTGTIKLINLNTNMILDKCNIILKISGIWVNNYYYGLCYTFMLTYPSVI